MRVIVVFALVAAVLAQLTLQNLRQAFEAIDSNDDQAVELSELEAYFDRFDANKDGFVNMREYIASRPVGEYEVETRASFDDNDRLDGTVDNKIARSIVTVVFNRLDANNNGRVTMEEFVTGYEKNSSK